MPEVTIEPTIADVASLGRTEAFRLASIGLELADIEDTSARTAAAWMALTMGVATFLSIAAPSKLETAIVA